LRRKSRSLIRVTAWSKPSATGLFPQLDLHFRLSAKVRRRHPKVSQLPLQVGLPGGKRLRCLLEHRSGQDHRSGFSRFHVSASQSSCSKDRINIRSDLVPVTLNTLPSLASLAISALPGIEIRFFRSLKDIRRNDRITITTPLGSFEYRVQFTQIVKPTDTSVLAPSSMVSLTLVTCYPFYFVGSAPERFIVRAIETGSALPS